MRGAIISGDARDEAHSLRRHALPALRSRERSRTRRTISPATRTSSRRSSKRSNENAVSSKRSKSRLFRREDRGKLAEIADDEVGRECAKLVCVVKSAEHGDRRSAGILSGADVLRAVADHPTLGQRSARAFGDRVDAGRIGLRRSIASSQMTAKRSSMPSRRRTSSATSRFLFVATAIFRGASMSSASITPGIGFVCSTGCSR